MNVYEEAVLADIARGEGKKNQKNRLKTKKTFPNALVTPAVQHRIGSLPSFLPYSGSAVRLQFCVVKGLKRQAAIDCIMFFLWTSSNGTRLGLSSSQFTDPTRKKKLCS